MKPGNEEVSQREYARRRGVTEGAVRKAVKAQRISVLPNGKIDPVIADKEWERNSLPRDASERVRTGTQGGTQGTQRGKRPAPAVETTLEPQPTGGALKRARAVDDMDCEFDPDAEFDPLNVPLNIGRRIKEASLAGIRLQEYRKSVGEMYERGVIKTLLFADRRAARDALRHLPRRLAPDLAEMDGNVQAIRERLELEIEAALNKLADDLPKLLSAAPAVDDADEPK